MGLTLLAQAKIPLTYWVEAFQTAVNLINRLPTSILQDSSPMYTLYKAEPKYNELHLFGCACYPCLRPYNTHKFQFHSQKYVYLGSASNHKGSKCLSSSGKIYISRHVVFDDTLFPFAAGFLNRGNGPSMPLYECQPTLISSGSSEETLLMPLGYEQQTNPLDNSHQTPTTSLLAQPILPTTPHNSQAQPTPSTTQSPRSSPTTPHTSHVQPTPPTTQLNHTYITSPCSQPSPRSLFQPSQSSSLHHNTHNPEISPPSSPISPPPPPQKHTSYDHKI